MKLVQVNTVCNGSTGKIMKEIQKEANNKGYDTISFFGRRKGFSDLKCEKFGGFFSFWFHVGITTLFDLQGYGSFFKTKKLVKRLREEKPAIIHLHNIHGYYLNYKVLFQFLKNEYTGKIFWTFHDCWPFTGHCAYFTEVNCNKWKKQCFHCPNKRKYPISFFKDNSFSNYCMKKKYFTGLKNLTIITPSEWLQSLVASSYLKEYTVKTINNGIDLDVFHKQVDENIYLKYGISKDKKILLGVANVWEKRKGLSDLLLLSQKISDDFVIFLVGLSKKQMKQLKRYSNIIGITRTENAHELVSLYSMSTFLINPTYEDNYPTVNIEALACGTRVISYDTGGCVEQARDNKNMYIVKKESFEKNVDRIITIINEVGDTYYDVSLEKYSSKNTSQKIIELYRKK